MLFSQDFNLARPVYSWHLGELQIVQFCPTEGQLIQTLEHHVEKN
jgi:hypothetical protein